MFKKIINVAVCLIILILFLGVGELQVNAFLNENKQVVVQTETKNQFFYYFYRIGCPFCDRTEIWFEGELKPIFPDFEMKKINVGREYRENNVFFNTLAKEFGITTAAEGLGGVPAVFISNYYLIGVPREREKEHIKSLVEKCLDNGCLSPTEAIKSADAKNIRFLPAGYFDKNRTVDDEKLTIGLPIFGEVNVEDVGFSIFTIMVAAMDGFNPCALWILLFLLAYAIKEKSRKKMILVAGTFILTSAIFYFFLLIGWLQLFKFLGYVGPLKIIIGILALVVGFFQIRGFFKKSQGCPTSLKNSKKYQRINEKIKKIFASNSLKFIIPGTIFLALTVNLFEFFCSAGFPAIFTSVMALQGFPVYLELSFIGLYVFIFMLDQIIIFTIAFITLKTITTTNKIAKWIGLIGGLLMILLGIILIFSPEYLVFI